MKNVADQRYYLVREDVLTDAMQKTKNYQSKGDWKEKRRENKMNKKLKEILLSVVRFVAVYAAIDIAESAIICIFLLNYFGNYTWGTICKITLLPNLIIILGISKIRNWILGKGKKKNKEDKTEEVAATEKNY